MLPYHVPHVLSLEGEVGSLSILFAPVHQGKFVEKRFFLTMGLAPTLRAPVSYPGLSSVIERPS